MPLPGRCVTRIEFEGVLEAGFGPAPVPLVERFYAGQRAVCRRHMGSAAESAFGCGRGLGKQRRRRCKLKGRGYQMAIGYPQICEPKACVLSQRSAVVFNGLRQTLDRSLTPEIASLEVQPVCRRNYASSVAA